MDIYYFTNMSLIVMEKGRSIGRSVNFQRGFGCIMESLLGTNLTFEKSVPLSF